MWFILVVLTSTSPMRPEWPGRRAGPSAWTPTSVRISVHLLRSVKVDDGIDGDKPARRRIVLAGADVHEP